MRGIGLIVVSLLTILSSFAQKKVLITFTDKDDVAFDPYQYFDQKAIERRAKHNLPLVDFTDLPVKEEYVLGITPYVLECNVVSRWLNASIAVVDENNIDVIRSLSYVDKVEVLGNPKCEIAEIKLDTVENSGLQLLKGQLNRMGRKTFRTKGITGAGVRIAIFDVGFKHVDQNKAFEHIRDEGRIIKTWNFVNNNEDVYKTDYHGTNVLSCIAGKNGSLEIGLATDAEFLLAKTERKLWEPFSEEENWLAAAEWADKNGAQIISSSLGYGYHRYFLDEMDGNTSLVARAARIATRKGILVVNSAGNEYGGRWGYLISPADVDSVLTVGGIDPYTGIGISFSSIGPTADYRPKPNVVSYGSVMASGRHEFGKTQGTSFSCPLISGFVACLLQANPNLTNMQLFRAIEKTGDLYPYFDYRHGYGVPHADNFFSKPTFPKSFEFTVDSFGYVNCVIDSVFLKDVLFEEDSVGSQHRVRSATDDYIINPHAVTDDLFYWLKPADRKVRDSKRQCFYYKVVDAKGAIIFYEVLDLFQPEVFICQENNIPPGGKIVVHYQGYTDSYSP